MKIELRNDSAHISGYVNAVGRDSRPLMSPSGKVVEMIEPGTFRNALKRAENVELLLNHNKERKLGSINDGNLTLTEDTIGLKADCTVTDPDVMQEARAGRLSGWSFGMFVNTDNIEERAGDIPRRHVTDIDLFEVSIIDSRMMPCYAGTSLECRADAEIVAETRAIEDKEHDISDETAADEEKQEEEARAKAALEEWEARLEELRSNPYHDPTNGRFTNASGGGMGGTVKKEWHYDYADYKHRADKLLSELESANNATITGSGVQHKKQRLLKEIGQQIDNISTEISRLEFNKANNKPVDGDVNQLLTTRRRLRLAYGKALGMRATESRKIEDWEARIEELRFNPYHDPTNGRFTDSSGGGMGGFLFVDKGQAGKGAYVINSEAFEKGAKTLDKKLIEQANATGSNFYEAGSAVERKYNSSLKTIDSLNISDDEKKTAKEKVFNYASDELKERSKYIDTYTAGPARSTNTKNHLDKAMSISGEHDSYIKDLKRKSDMNTAAENRKRFTAALSEATNAGSLEMNYDGKSYFRVNKKSGTWREGTLKDYKAEQAFYKEQKNLPMHQQKSWSSISANDKARYYRATENSNANDDESGS